MQKEKLSALMDNESLDNEVLSVLSEDTTLQQTWERWHLIRDTLRGEVPDVIHLDMAARIARAIKNEPVSKVTTLITETQPTVKQQEKLPFWRKTGPWAAHLTQVGVAACVSLAVIVGVQQHNRPQQEMEQQPESPAFTTLPMMGNASPVSLGVPTGGVNAVDTPVRAQQQRADAALQDYELQRRLHSEQLQSGTEPSQQNSETQQQ